MPRGAAPHAVRLLWILPALVGAQAPPPPPVKWHGLTVSGNIRSRLENWNYFESDSAADGTYSFLGTLARLSISKTSAKFDWQIEMAAPILLGLPDAAVVPGVAGGLGLGANYFTANRNQRNVASVFTRQAFVRFKEKAHSLRAGRFEYIDGSELPPKSATLAYLKQTRINQRLLGPFVFTHVQRSFDGLHYQHSPAGAGNLTILAAVPTRGVFQTDGWGWNQTAIGYGAYTRPWGKGKHSAETRLLALFYDDWRDGVVKTDNRPLVVRRGDVTEDIRIGTFGGHTLHAYEADSGTADFVLWGVAQAGKWGRLDHRAHAILVEGGFQPKAWKKVRPWLRAGFHDGSGDGNANDSTHGTFFQVLPTPRPFARFPFFNMMNNRDVMGAFILRPHPKVTISNEFHSLSLSNRNDLWLQGGGVFQPWTFGYAGRDAAGAKSLGNLYDCSVDYRMSPAMTFNIYFGHAQGLSAIRAIYPRGQSGNLGFVELTYRF